MTSDTKVVTPPVENHRRPYQTAEFYWTAGFALLWLMVTYVLVPPAPLAPSLDAGWQAMLVEEFLHHAQFGKDIVFTYGPWGFLSEPRGNLAIYPWLVLGRLVLALGFGIGAAWLVTISKIRPGFLRWIYLLFILAWANAVLLVPFTLFCVLFEGGEERGWRRTLAIWLLIPACALAAHIKLTVLPLFMLMALLLLIHESFVRKGVPWLFVALVTAYFLWYLAALQSIRYYWAYISSSVSMASSYNFAQFESNGSGSTLLMGFLLCAAMVLGYLAALSHSRRWLLLPGALWIAGFFFLGFKEAFVRQDSEHLWMGMINVVIPASLLLALRLSDSPLFQTGLVQIPSANKSFDGRQILNVFVIVASVFFAYRALRTHTLQDFFGASWHSVREISPTLASRPGRAARYAGELAALKARYPLAPLSGGVDILPWDDFWVLANSLQLQPRPVFQSNVAMNDRLMRINADFFSGLDAPDFVLTDVATNEETHPRYPSMQDNLAWLSLLSHYDPVSFSGNYLVLKKSRSYLVESQDLGTHTVSWQQPLKIPNGDGLIWAEINVSPRPVGFLAAMLLRPRPIVMQVEAAGQLKEYRFLTMIGKAGFLLSPVVDDPVSFAALYMGSEGRGLLREVSTISFMTSTLGHATYSPEISVRLKSLSVPPRSISGVLSSEFRSLAESVRSSAGLNRVVAPPVWRVADGHLRLEVQAPSSGEVPLASPGRLRFRLGVQNRCRELPDASSTIEFRATLRPPQHDAAEILIDRRLSASGAEDLVEEHQIDVRNSGTLTLETEFAGGTCPIGAYWSDLKFERR